MKCARVDLAAGLLVLLAACATPVPPTGGPRDTTAPKLLRSEPADGSVRFAGRDLAFRFDEYVDRGSFARALRFEPDPGMAYTIDWSRTSVRVRFERELPANTTLIVTLGNDLRDTRGNRLGEPIRLAFSTGDRIDSTHVRVPLLDRRTGKRPDDVMVFLWPETAAFSDRARYTAPTDTAGYAVFRFIPPGTYKIAAVDDANRNRTWETGREAAWPWTRAMVDIQAGDSLRLPVWVVDRPDTIPPRLEGVGLLSSSRIRTRFSEPVMAGPLQLKTDSLQFEARPLHRDAADPTVWYHQPDTQLRAGLTYRVSAGSLADSAGNATSPEPLELDGADVPDSTRYRLVDSSPYGFILPTDTLRSTYSTAVKPEALRDSLSVYSDRMPVAGYRDSIAHNRYLILPPAGGWPVAGVLTFNLWNPDAGRFDRVTRSVRNPAQRGELEIALPDSTTRYRVDIRTRSGALVHAGSGIDRITVGELDPGIYRVDVWQDVNGNGRWDSGSVIPYTEPEPYRLELGVRIRTGFTTELRFRE